MAGGMVNIVGGLIKVFSLVFGFEVPIALFEVGSFEIPIVIG